MVESFRKIRIHNLKLTQISPIFSRPRKTPDHHEAHQFQEKCWNDFIKSDSGSQVLDQFSQKQDAVRKILTDHDEAQQNLAIGMGKLTHLQLQLDILEQDRKFKGRLLDEHGIPMIITSPQEQQVRLEIQVCKFYFLQKISGNINYFFCRAF